MGEKMPRRVSKESEEIRKKILDFLKSDGGKATSEIARHLGLSHNQTVYHLRILASDGLVRRKKKSPQVVLWYAVEENV